MSDVQSSSPILDIKNVSVSYGKHDAVMNASWSLNRGLTYGLIGLNGAGKTTLIKSILRLRTRYKGSIDFTGLTEQEINSAVAYLPEKFSPPEFLTGYEFLELSGRLYGKETARGDGLQFSQNLGLDETDLKRRIATYSKGMRQKIGLLSLFLSGAEFLILDEPMSGLDPLARAMVKDALVEAKQRGKTILLSSHILADMDEICDEVAVLHDKEIKFIGSPDAMKSKTKAQSLERAFYHFIEYKKVA